MASHCPYTTTSGFRSPPLRRVSVTAADGGCTDQHKPQIIYQLLKGGVLFYHPLQDSFRFHQMVGCTIYLAFLYLEDYPVAMSIWAAFKCAYQLTYTAVPIS